MYMLMKLSTLVNDPVPLVGMVACYWSCCSFVWGISANCFGYNKGVANQTVVVLCWTVIAIPSELENIDS